jgi:hypothetical protein
VPVTAITSRLGILAADRDVNALIAALLRCRITPLPAEITCRVDP